MSGYGCLVDNISDVVAGCDWSRVFNKRIILTRGRVLIGLHYILLNLSWQTKSLILSDNLLVSVLSDLPGSVLRNVFVHLLLLRFVMRIKGAALLFIA